METRFSHRPTWIEILDCPLSPLLPPLPPTACHRPMHDDNSFYTRWRSDVVLLIYLFIYFHTERERGGIPYACNYIVYCLFYIVFSSLASHEAGRVAREYKCEHADMRTCESANLRICETLGQGCWDEMKRRCSELSGFAWMDRRIYSFYLCSIGVICYDPPPRPKYQIPNTKYQIPNSIHTYLMLMERLRSGGSIPDPLMQPGRFARISAPAPTERG